MKFNIGKKVKKVIQNWLQIIPATEQNIVLMEKTGFVTDVIRSQLWYRGDSNELFQFFHQIDNGLNSFWGSVPANEKMRKIHSGLPAIIADTLTYIVQSDLDNVEINRIDWDIISEKINFRNLVGKSICNTLVDGDGAFKISVDTVLSDYPIIDFVGADKVRYDYRRGLLHEVIFMTDYSFKSSTYRLEEHYGNGYIKSYLYDHNGNEVNLKVIPELEEIPPEITFAGNYIMAVPLKFYESKKYANRGKSIFDGGKSDCFDALDEIVSQWLDAIRAGRVQKYIPECMIPRDFNNGSLKSVNSFGTEFITVESPISETSERPKIEVVQPDIKYEAFVSAYTNCLLMCLQGLVSPATLGIDVGKMSSADAQREKKDVTGNTRNTITTALEKVLPELITAILKTHDNMQGKVPEEYEVSVDFGEYGAPDFDSRVETIGKASTYGIMSVETQVEELWGSSKNDEWKQSEVQRIIAERGLMNTDEISIGGA